MIEDSTQFGAAVSSARGAPGLTQRELRCPSTTANGSLVFQHMAARNIILLPDVVISDAATRNDP